MADAGKPMGASPPDAGRRDLRQRLRVTGVEGATVRVQADRQSGCAQCAARAGCGAGALAEVLGPAPLDLALPRCGAVAPGDEVVVAMSGGAFLGAAGLAYLVPPAALVLAAGAFSALGLPDPAVAGLCLPVLALSLLPARIADRRGRLATALRIEEVLPAPGRGRP